MLESLRYSNWLHRYIKISTPEVYGSNNGLVKENFQYAPTTPYAISHSAIDMNLVALHKQYAFPVIFTRFANFYGPHQQLYRLIPRTIIYALTGKILQLQGGGAATRGFIYGEDVADGIMRTINQGILGEIYHFSPERFFTIRQVVEIICNKLNIRFNDFTNFVPDRPGKDQAYLMDSTKARMKLDWTESVSFESGIDSTIEWIKSSIDEIQSTPLEYVHKK
jgi:dTDP-glucose 4,6-dehydratase